MSDEPSPALLLRLDRLSEQLDSVEHAVRENKDQIDEQRRQGEMIAALLADLAAAQQELDPKHKGSLAWKNERGARRRNRAIFGLIAVVVLVVALLYKQAHDQEQARLDQRIAGCKAYNVDVSDRVNGILDGLAATSKDPVAAEALVARFKLPHRNCTVEGLSDYVKNPQGPNAYEQPGG